MTDLKQNLSEKINSRANGGGDAERNPMDVIMVQKRHGKSIKEARNLSREAHAKSYLLRGLLQKISLH